MLLLAAYRCTWTCVQSKCTCMLAKLRKSKLFVDTLYFSAVYTTCVGIIMPSYTPSIWLESLQHQSDFMPLVYFHSIPTRDWKESKQFNVCSFSNSESIANVISKQKTTQNPNRKCHRIVVNSNSFIFSAFGLSKDAYLLADDDSDELEINNTKFNQTLFIWT